MADIYDHSPEVWTAGRLREAIKNLPDETPVHIGVAPEPGSFEGYQECVLVDFEPVELLWPATKAAPERTEVQHTLFADWQPGPYDVLED